MAERRTLRRRQVVIGGAGLVGAGAGGAAWLALRGGRSNAPAADTTPFATPTSVPQPTAKPTRPRGGVGRLQSPAGFNFDTFDGQRSGEVTAVEVLGRTHSRMVQWTDFQAPALGPDLATSWEQPESTRLVLHLDPKARWQARDPLNARPVTAADVVAHFIRTLAIAKQSRTPLDQRMQDYAAVQRVSAPEDGVVLFETARPDPFLLNTLAGRFALVQAPEAVAKFEATWPERRPAEVVGSGPWQFLGEKDGALRFSAFRDGHLSPLMDALEVQESVDVVARFQAKQLDEALTRDRRDAAALRALGAGVAELARFEESPVITSVGLSGAPWNNADLLRALSGALNRGELAKRLFGGRAAPAGPVPPSAPGFALTGAELAAYPGYNQDAAADAKDARARWQAAGGPGLGTVTVDFPSIFDPLYSASATVTGMLSEVLGNQFKATVQTYTTIAETRYGTGSVRLWFGWGPAVAEPDPTRQMIEYYRSVPGVTNKLNPTGLAQAATVFGIEARQAAIREASKKILDGGGLGIITWLQQRSEVFRWGYAAGLAPSPYWTQHLDGGRYLEPADPSYQGR